MERAAARRLPGLRFERQAAPVPEPLPRMDVAALVGFAAAGPIDVPVAVEDPAQFREIFGDDAELGRDPAEGAVATAHLGPAVRAFFRNGGRRCWVVRVAGPGASAASVAIPGLLGWRGDRLWQARAQGRSKGSWGDALGAAATVTVRAVPLPAEGAWLTFFKEDRIEERRTPPLASLLLAPEVAGQLAPGDLLRLTVPSRPPSAGDAAVAYLPVMRWQRPEGRPASLDAPADAGGLVAVAVEAPLWLARGLPEGLRTEGLRAWTQDAGPVEAAIERGAAGGDPARQERVAVLLAGDPASAPPIGSLVAIDEGGAARETPDGLACAWLVVEERGTAPGPALPTRLVGTVLRTAPPPARVPLQGCTCERLELELEARRKTEPIVHLAGLGLGPDHGRYWAALPDDEALLAEPAGAPSRPRGALWEAARSPRFPLAGEALPADEGPTFYAPLAPGASRSGWSSARFGERPALVRDGLHPLEVRTFVDEALAEARSETLLAEAEFVAWQSPLPRRLRGIHSLLWNDEVSLVAVPDAVQRGWRLAPEPPEPPPAPAPTPAARRCQPLDGGAPGPGDFSGVPAPTAAPSPAPEPWPAPPRPLERLEACPAPPPGLLLAVQRALLRLCAARGDLLAVLSAPAGAREAEVILHAARLRSEADDAPAEARPADATVARLGGLEARALSHGALYHPWAWEVEGDGARLRPPDGMVAGSLALRAWERGAWVAPANEVLRGVVALEPALSRDRWGDLQEAQVNALRQEPRGFLVLSSDTLSRDPELVGIQVRRLLALLRRAALRLGAGYVFEPLSPALRRMVERGFTELLTGLFARGAFAGARPERAFQVDAGVLADGRRDEERGRFFVELRVAPSTPLRFLRVRLVQGGERALVTEGS